MIDPNIKPERKNSIELGLDVRFLNGRLGFDFAWYDETINDQIGMLPLPEESGATGRFTNVGSLKNEGIELTVNATPVKVSDFSWKTTFNYWNNTTTYKICTKILEHIKCLMVWQAMETIVLPQLVLTVENMVF